MKKWLIVLALCLMTVSVGATEEDYTLEFIGEAGIANWEIRNPNPTYDCPMHYGTEHSFYVYVDRKEHIFCGDCFMEFLRGNIFEVEEIEESEEK